MNDTSAYFGGPRLLYIENECMSGTAYPKAQHNIPGNMLMQRSYDNFKSRNIPPDFLVGLKKSLQKFQAFLLGLFALFHLCSDCQRRFWKSLPISKDLRHVFIQTHYTVLKKEQTTCWQRMRTATPINGPSFSHNNLVQAAAALPNAPFSFKRKLMR